jgi:hypothetical protein
MLIFPPARGTPGYRCGVLSFSPSLSTVWPAHSQTIHRCRSLRSHFQALWYARNAEAIKPFACPRQPGPAGRMNYRSHDPSVTRSLPFPGIVPGTVAAFPSDHAMTTASPLPGDRPSRCLKFPKPLLPSLLSSRMPRAPNFHVGAQRSARSSGSGGNAIAGCLSSVISSGISGIRSNLGWIPKQTTQPAHGPRPERRKPLIRLAKLQSGVPA